MISIGSSVVCSLKQTDFVTPVKSSLNNLINSIVLGSSTIEISIKQAV